ncbi:MAG: PilZ domain-containing protein [Terriglobales bacterium]
MSGPKTDKRAQSRIPVSVPATVRSRETATETSARTRDLSMGGVFLYTDRRITEGSKLEIVLILPAELGLGEKQWACCHASVVRVEDGEGQPFGIAATIDRLDMLPEIPS